VSASKGTVLLLVLAGLLALGGAPASAARASVAPVSAAAFSPVAGPLPAEASGSAAPQQRTKVRMGMILSIAGTPFFITQDRGYFAAENLDVDFEPVQVTSEAIAQVAAGNLDLAIATVGAAVLNTVSRGIDIRIVSGVHGNPPSGHGGDPMLARKDLYDAGLVRDANGLRGRKVAGNSLGVYTEYAINGAMRTAGLTIDDVEFVAIPFPDIPNALANQAVDAAFVPEPAATAAIDRGVGVQIIPEFLRGAQITVLIAGPSFLRDRVAAEGFMRAYIRGLRDLQTEGWNSPSVAESIERYVRVPAAVAMKILPEYADPEGRINWDSLMDQQRFYMDRGYTNYTQPIELTRLNDDGPRQAALQSLSR
jgi:NitT/TauT family transport system substrate-binding protein